MCVRIHLAPPNTVPRFDADGREIILPSGLPHAHTVILIRAILTELAVPQPELGAVCWCGEPVDLTPRVPDQRRSEQVARHGA